MNLIEDVIAYGMVVLVAIITFSMLALHLMDLWKTGNRRDAIGTFFATVIAYVITGVAFFKYVN